MAVFFDFVREYILSALNRGGSVMPIKRRICIPRGIPLLF